MGVTKLWQLLEEAGEGDVVSLSHCSGQSWAVDLSAWIVHGRTGGKANISTTFTMMRTVFYRALSLLKHGIRPIFVMDGQVAPAIKTQTMNNRCEKMYGHSKVNGNDRSGILSSNNMCKRMLEALGLTVVTSPGEAEKTCALLNKQGIVDACLTDDSDALLYGATTLYRNLNIKDENVEKHTMSVIEQKLQLSQRDFVAMALLSGCDYGGGLKGVGPKKVIGLIHSMKRYSYNVLERICDWPNNKELDKQQEERTQLAKTPKQRHCGLCQHPGSVKQHNKEGCMVCQSSDGCKEDADIPCICTFHKGYQDVAPYATELDLRMQAVKDPTFPDKQLINEFLESTETFSFKRVVVVMPNWENLVGEVQIASNELMRKMVPVLLFMHLHGTLTLSDAKPLRILRESIQNGVLCYQVMWQQFEFDKWTGQTTYNAEVTPPSKKQKSENPYIAHFPRDLFAKWYPAMVAEFAKSTTKKGKGKRTVDNSTQQKLTSFFTVKKRLNFKEEENP